MTRRMPQFLVVAAVQFFLCEFLVSGAWRGSYSYTQNFISDLGLPYCGPDGTAPCSTSYLLMTVSFVVLGIALLAAAARLGWGPVLSAGPVFLTAAGIGAVVVGLVPSNRNWPLHSLGASLFLIFGSCAVLTIGLSSATTPRRAVRFVSVALGLLGLAGYFSYSYGWHLGLGIGGIERVAAYSVILGFVCVVLLMEAARVAEPGPARPELHPAPRPGHVDHLRNGVGIATIGAVVLLVFGSGPGVAPAHAAPATGSMVDDFDGAAGSSPGSAWTYDLGGGGWGNGEAQAYTNRRENARLDGDGHLVIDAVRQDDGTFTSARITTRDIFSFSEGRAEARIKVPAGAGLHPAFWLLGNDIDRVGWPQAGEIDVMETVNDAASYGCTLHGPDATGAAWQVGATDSPPAPLSADFHTYWVQRSPGSVSMGIDDRTTCSFTPETVGAENVWVFDQPFFLLLNVAAGGTYSGPTNDRTPSVSTMLVDWVRVSP